MRYPLRPCLQKRENHRLSAGDPKDQNQCSQGDAGLHQHAFHRSFEEREREEIQVYLGFSLFAWIEAGAFKESPFTRRLFQLFYERGNTYYGFKNLEFHKERYRAEKRRVFFACKSRVPVKQLIDGFRLCGVLNARTIFPFVWSLAKQ